MILVIKEIKERYISTVDFRISAGMSPRLKIISRTKSSGTG